MSKEDFQGQRLLTKEQLNRLTPNSSVLTGMSPEKRTKVIKDMCAYVLSKGWAEQNYSHEQRVLVLKSLFEAYLFAPPPEKELIVETVRCLVFGPDEEKSRGGSQLMHQEKSEDCLVLLAEGLYRLLAYDSIRMTQIYGGEPAFPLPEEHRKVFEECLLSLSQRKVFVAKVIAGELWGSLQSGSPEQPRFSEDPVFFIGILSQKTEGFYQN